MLYVAILVVTTDDIIISAEIIWKYPECGAQKKKLYKGLIY